MMDSHLTPQTRLAGVIEDESLTQRLAAMDIHQPERVVIEYNECAACKFEQMELRRLGRYLGDYLWMQLLTSGLYGKSNMKLFMDTLYCCQKESYTPTIV